MSKILNLPALLAAPLAASPFDHMVVPGFVSPDAHASIVADFPRISQTGSFPVDSLAYGPGFEALLQELESPEVIRALSEKFDLELSAYPMLVTVRGQSGPEDGFVHTDSSWKIVSLLLYLNDRWMAEGGRLRLLRSKDLDNWAVEVPPDWGTMLAFRRSDRSFHGHERYDGPRRVLQINWVTSEARRRRELRRHRRALLLKRLAPALHWRPMRSYADRASR